MGLGGGGQSTNWMLLAEQRAEAERAERRERELQGRLTSGRGEITARFSPEGGTYTTPETWGLVQAGTGGTPPSGGRIENPEYTRWVARGRDGWAPPRYVWRNPGTPGTQDQFGWIPGEEVTVPGIGQDFFENYRQAALDFAMPEVARLAGEARSANLFDLGRRGITRSSEAVDKAADLLRERTLAEAQVTSDAEQQTAALRQDVARAEQNALTLLQQTEDPTLASNVAQGEINAVQLRQPTFSPLALAFTPLANAYANYRDVQRAREYRDQVPVSSPYSGSGSNFA